MKGNVKKINKFSKRSAKFLLKKYIIQRTFAYFTFMLF